MNVAVRCVIATDSPEIASVAASAGAEAVMTSPDHATGTDRVAEVAALPAFSGYRAILNVQGDEPFVSAAAVKGALSLLASGRFDVATAAAPADHDRLGAPEIVKVVSADDGRALYFSRSAIPYVREEEDRALLRNIARQHVGVYAYTRDALSRWVALPEHPLERVERLEQLRALAGGLTIGVAMIDEVPAGGIDTLDDLQRANIYWTDTLPERS
jgi:3-deoxy-manno-octulosonate cytidylyltransferase (CMP-KDO synthetase)